MYYYRKIVIDTYTRAFNQIYVLNRFTLVEHKRSHKNALFNKRSKYSPIIPTQHRRNDKKRARTTRAPQTSQNEFESKRVNVRLIM